jgi:hypothetical protein
MKWNHPIESLLNVTLQSSKKANFVVIFKFDDVKKQNAVFASRGLGK